jgi:hypothetical protein
MRSDSSWLKKFGSVDVGSCCYGNHHSSVVMTTPPTNEVRSLTEKENN